MHFISTRKITKVEAVGETEDTQYVLSNQNRTKVFHCLQRVQNIILYNSLQA